MSVPVLAQANFSLTPLVIIDIIGILIGVSSILMIYSASKAFVGPIRSSIKLTIYGISLMIFALLYTLTFVRFKLFPVPGGLDIHHLFMLLGMLMFVLSAYNMTKLKLR
jgi:hypothetical protein